MTIPSIFPSPKGSLTQTHDNVEIKIAVLLLNAQVTEPASIDRLVGSNHMVWMLLNADTRLWSQRCHTWEKWGVGYREAFGFEVLQVI